MLPNWFNLVPPLNKLTLPPVAITSIHVAYVWPVSYSKLQFCLVISWPDAWLSDELNYYC
jgi:hypothetical protein